jgi:hypothetical protein
VKSAMEYAINAIPVGRQVVLDMSNPIIFDFVQESYDRAGLGHERYPGLHRAFHDLRANRGRQIQQQPPTMLEASLLDDGWQTGAQMTGIARTAARGDAASTGYVTFVGGVATCLSVIQVLENDDILATGGGTGFSDATTILLKTSAVDAKPLPEEKPLMVNILYTYQKVVGGPVSVVNYQVPQSALGALQMPTVTQPIVKPAHAANAMIKIGLGRGPAGQNKDDVDYWFWQGTNDTSYAVPFVGNVTFSANIRTPLTAGTNFFPDFSLVRTDGGYKKLSGAPLDAAIAAFAANGAALNWSMPATDDPNTSKPINFGQLNWQVESNVYFNAQFPVTLTNNVLAYAAVVSADQQPVNDQGITYIKPLWFVYHCVAAGTQITLADGSTSPVEKITSSNSVQIDTSGKSLKVRGNTVARHRGIVYRLGTKSGRSLVMSYGHVILTNEGPVAAQDLQLGQMVQTLEGTEPITGLESFERDEMLFNMELDTGDATDGASLFANGIRVGDTVMQANYRRNRRRNLDVVLSRIDPMFHQDCINSGRL